MQFVNGRYPKQFRGVIYEFCDNRRSVTHTLRRGVNEFISVLLHYGDRGGTVVKVLCCKPEGRWLIPDSVIGIFH